MNIKNILKETLVKDYKIDLWIITALMILTPQSIKTLDSHIPVEHPSIVTIIIIGLFLFAAFGLIIIAIWMLKRCGMLIKYRYILIKNNCMYSPKNAFIYKYIILLEIVFFGYIFCTRPIVGLLVQFGYIMIVILLSITLEDNNTYNKE